MSLERFQTLLREIFQFDAADLDFGIYRILNYKRDQFEAFVTDRLPRIVDEAFGDYAAAEKEQIEKELEQAQAEITKTLGAAALEDGDLKTTFYETPLGKRYLSIRERAVRYEVGEELKIRVYNDLFTFFSRYYDEGDFISKRRYGRRETYAIPYNGEEVYLYWANRDQFYVKTTDRLKTYRFKVDDYTVEFEIREAEADGNGTNGRRRYFVLARSHPVTWDEENRVLTIGFEFRSLTEAEEKDHGRTEQQRPQDSLNGAAEERVIAGVHDATLKAALARPDPRGTNGRTILRARLDHFTRRNTADFFIHKALKGFLQRELDFFIKNEVLLLDELVSGKEENLQEHLRRARVVRQVAEPIIDFLAQVEEFQKKLWLKKKFVVETNYCLTLDLVPEELYPEVAANDAQREEWVRLFAIDEMTGDMVTAGYSQPLTVEFLKANPYLILDTSLFSQAFKDQLLSCIDNVDEKLDGLLVHGENFQALNLLAPRYTGKVQCVYIDPPYNSPSTEILYKNNYRHASWLCLMGDRLRLSAEIAKNMPHLIAIDENEGIRLGMLLEELFPTSDITSVSIVHNPRGIQGDNFKYSHEYCVFILPVGEKIVRPGRIPQEEWEFTPLRNWGGESDRADGGPGTFYPVLVENDRIVGVGESAAEDYHPGAAVVPLMGGRVEVWPIDSGGREKKWRYARTSLLNILENDPGRVRVVQVNGEPQIQIAKVTDDRKTVWIGPQYDAGTHGTRLLTAMLGAARQFTFPKSVHQVRECIESVTNDTACVLDYFAGSGTTAHAVINLNRECGNRRTYILVEIGEYFDSVMKPRVLKAAYSSDWRDGKPLSRDGMSQLVKYIRLESYDDTLLNIEFPRSDDGQAVLELFGDEYLLRYMLDFEAEGSASLLNLDMMKEPFSYKLKVQNGEEIAERVVDLPETFNYLLGLQLNKIRSFDLSGRSYRGVMGIRNDKRVAVIWRPVRDIEEDKDALLADRTHIEETILPELLGQNASPDILYVNGPCYAAGAQPIEPEFKRLMFSNTP